MFVSHERSIFEAVQLALRGLDRTDIVDFNHPYIVELMDEANKLKDYLSYLKENSFDNDLIRTELNSSSEVIENIERIISKIKRRNRSNRSVFIDNSTYRNRPGEM